ncbi:TPA: RpiB/LacA/LacB family sugar-phosphate isomerase [Candidatus Micrarchaeota archaeon]|nr:RpiB/LacA/LacB family sugar-phosphate isomerase [Candidatus Micrarchaeota archaeon]
MGFVVSKVYLGSDHAGFKLKEFVKKLLLEQGLEVKDLGTKSEDSVDYPDFIIPCAEAVAKSGGKAFGIVFGGSGIGECIAANKVKGIRCALAYDLYTAQVTREHNDSNMLALGARTITGDEKLTKEIVLKWLSTPFSKDERHMRRIKKIGDYEKDPLDYLTSLNIKGTRNKTPLQMKREAQKAMQDELNQESA